MQTPATKHSGIIYKQWNDQISLRQGYSYIKNNQISLLERFNAGDLLCQVTESYTPYWLNGTGLSTTNWLLLGYVIPGYAYQQLKLNVEGYNFVANYKLERIGTNTYLTQRTTEKTNTDVTLELGFKYIGNQNGYNVFAVYLRQTAGTALKTDMTIEALNKNSPFIPIQIGLLDPSFVKDTMDTTYTI